MSGTELKILALIFMTIDHIGVCIPGMPIWLRWIGRLSSPLFFFCAAEGIMHTRDKKLYLKRLWKMSILMVFIESALPALLKMTVGISPYFNNNIFASIFQGTLIIYLLEKTKDSRSKRVKYILIYAGYQIAVMILYVLYNMAGFLDSFYLIPIISDADRFIFTALGSIIMMEGSLILTSAIVVFYFCRNNKKRLAAVYSMYCTAYFIVFVFQIPLRTVNFMYRIGIPRLLVECFRSVCSILGMETIFPAGDLVNSLLHINFQWMMIFALPFMLAYNGEKGRGLKRLFYIYYPVHLIVLNMIGELLKLR